MKKIIMALFVLTILFAATAGYAQPSSIHGTWHITAVLTATSTPNPYVKEGHLKEETWQIAQQGDQAVLTTPNGSIHGRFLTHTHEFPQGVWQFELMVPNFLGQPNLGARFEVVLVPRSANVISGGSTVTYFNTFGGQWAPAGIESFRFEGNRLQ